MKVAMGSEGDTQRPRTRRPLSEGHPGNRTACGPDTSCLENPMDRGAWQAIVHRVAKSRT